jgi:hypothetical protein
MKALSELLIALAVLAAVPGTLMASPFVVDEIMDTVPQFSSPFEETQFWSHIFGP